MVFSIIVPSSSVGAFDNSRQTSLCNALTSGWNAPTSGVACTIGSVSSFNGSSVLVNGFAYFTWTVNPAITNLNTATSQRDQRVTTLTTSAASILGGSFPGAVPNCACNGIDVVTIPSTSAFTYNVNITGIPGPMQCGARLTYNSGVATAIINQVGVDDGSINIANLGKFCSTPALIGGVVGVPGQSSCRQYGVVASAAGTTQAVVNSNIGQGVAITNGAVTRVDFTGGNAGAGYTSAPTVTVAAPNPLGVTATYTLDRSAKPSGLATATTTTITPVANGPYIGIPQGTIGGGICVDVDIAPRCTGAVTAITDAANQVRSGRRCVDADFNGNTCGLVPGACITLVAGVITNVYYPGTANTFCTNAPTVTLSTNTLQLPVTAQVTATLGGGGVITALNIVSGGSGYRTLPTVTISAPLADQIGKLCSLNPIPSLPPSIGYPVSIAAGITVAGECRPLGRNTYTNKVCSVPAAPGGEWNTLNAFTCNVGSSFIAQPGSSTTNTCGILAQSFTTTAPPNPSSPPSPPAPNPALSPPPSTTAPPPPPPNPPKKCTYYGIYRLESNACRTQFIAYDVGGNNCKNTTVYLRTISKASGVRTRWRLKATSETGKISVPSNIVALGRATCPIKGIINLSPSSNAFKPVVKLGSPSTKLRIDAVDEFKSCSLVTIQATSSNYNGKYLGYKTPCSNEQNFIWSNSARGKSMQWYLRKV